ncbi:MAG TPA: hypothetical protein VFH27_13910, partial [Longimicrobiaceae bacterium]|nr:hypothetical protein [Longimicrobiaceae bacterium]
TLEVRVDVYGPDAAPDPAAHPEWAVDPLWDLPVETVPLPGDPDDVSDGTALPAGYVVRAGSSRAVTLELGRFSSESFDFS